MNRLENNHTFKTNESRKKKNHMRKESHENNQITWKESREKWIVWKELHAKINESRKKYRMRKESREKQTTSKESQVKKLIVWKELHVKINESHVEKNDVESHMYK